MTLTAQQNIISTVKQYGQKLFGFIRNRVNSREDAEDILQDVWQQLSGVVNLDEIEQVSAWLLNYWMTLATRMRRENSILTPVLLVNPLGFWQAGGLLVLYRILFGGFGGVRWGHLPGANPPFGRNRFANMTQDEKERVRAEWKKPCFQRKEP